MGEVIWGTNFRDRRSEAAVRRIIHSQTYIPKPLIVAGEAVEALFERLKGIERDNASELVNCVLCQNPISGVTSNDLIDYQYYTDGGPLHPRCYEETYKPENLRRAEEWAEKNLATLDMLRDY